MIQFLKKYVSKEENENGFLLIFTVAFLLYLDPAGDSNPAGHLLTLTKPNLT